MNFKTTAEIISELAILKFFPSGPEAMLAMVKLVGDMAETEDQVRWLVRRTLALYNEWPGPKELRAIFCSKFKPKDGINAYSQLFVDGISSERPPALPAPEMKRIGPGECSADPGLYAMVETLSKSTEMPRAMRGKNDASRRLEAVLTAPKDRPELPSPTPQVITQDDVDREVALLRKRKIQGGGAVDAR